MAVSIGSAGVTFNDSTIQTTAASPAGYVFLQRTVASQASSVNFTISGYGTYLLMFYNVTGPTANDPIESHGLAAKINNANTNAKSYYGGGYNIGGVGQVPRSGSGNDRYIHVSGRDYHTFEGTRVAMMNGQMTFTNMAASGNKYGSGFIGGSANQASQPVTTFGAVTSFETTSSYGTATSLNLFMWNFDTSERAFSGTFDLYGLKTS